MKKIKVFSLFTGVTGLDRPFHEDSDNFEMMGFAEIDKHASAILKYLYPNIENLGDLTKIDIEKMKDFDLLTFGFSCQPYSVAGKRLGLEDLRGQVIYNVFEIIKHKKPKFLLAENVKGLLSHNKGQTFKFILSELSSLGYSIDFELINAKNFGVPQNRERVFIVGVRNDKEEEKKESLDSSGENEEGYFGKSPRDIAHLLRHSEDPYDQYTEIKGYFRTGRERKILSSKREIGENNKIEQNEQQGQEGESKKLEFYGAIDSKRWNKKSDKILSRNFSQGERIYSDGGISPQISANMGGTANGSALIATKEPFIATKFLGRNGKLTSKDCPTIQTGDLPHIIKVYDKASTGKKSQAGTVYDSKGIFPTVSAGTHGYAMGQILEDKKEDLLAWSSSGRDGYREERITTSHANTLNTGEGCRTQSSANYVSDNVRIRRLTPLECERLMSWPDNSTKLGNYNGEIKEVSDTQRYKCCGNGVVSACVYSIKNLIKNLNKNNK